MRQYGSHDGSGSGFGAILDHHRGSGSGLGYGSVDGSGRDYFGSGSGLGSGFPRSSI
jgi:hypothetical protein